ncbi:unnamed protein product [Brassica napus]|uniref:(rape) hypothetical protein n=1 Tax=Brassica napus TaxID=3708 RepID=A0A816QDC4_BRANA|nr:unnamed protein product [Brassica napus]
MFRNSLSLQRNFVSISLIKFIDFCKLAHWFFMLKRATESHFLSSAPIYATRRSDS